MVPGRPSNMPAEEESSSMGIPMLDRIEGATKKALPAGLSPTLALVASLIVNAILLLFVLVAVATPPSSAPAPAPPTPPAAPPPPALKALDLSDPAQSTEAVIKTRCSLEPDEEIFNYIAGEVFRWMAPPPHKRAEKIFLIEGVSISRCVRRPSGDYQVLSREIVLYKDMYTGEILNTWNNSKGQIVEVTHIANDPVNFVMPKMVWPHKEIDDRISFDFEVFLEYPNPLPREEFPFNSAGDMYEGAELFQFFAKKSELSDPTVKKAFGFNSWTRFGQYLPWMEEGDMPGHLVYYATAEKVASFQALPKDIKDYISSRAPKYEHAPLEVERENETSWRVWKGLIERRERVFRDFVGQALARPSLAPSVREALQGLLDGYSRHEMPLREAVERGGALLRGVNAALADRMEMYVKAERVP